MGNILSYTCNGLGDKLLQSCADGDLVAVRQLMQEHSRLCFWYRLSDGATPLHIAAANGQFDIALRLIETASKQRHFENPREAEIAAKSVQNMLNARNSLGQSPLMLACRSGRADITKLLLANGANPLLTDSFQFKTCLHYAAQFGWGNCCTVLLSDTTFIRGTQQLLRTTEVRSRDGNSRKFIDMDAQSGYTALHIAASHGHLETSKVLLRYGASLNRECAGSLRTPFSRNHRMPMIGRPHVTALHIAAARRNIPMCRAMLRAHAVYVASSDSAVGGGQPVFDIRTVRDHFDQRPVDIATALGCVPLAAMLDPSLPLHLATVGDGSQGPLGPQTLVALSSAALREGLILQLKAINKLEAQKPLTDKLRKHVLSLGRVSLKIPALYPPGYSPQRNADPASDQCQHGTTRAVSVSSAQSPLKNWSLHPRDDWTSTSADDSNPLSFRSNRSHSATTPRCVPASFWSQEMQTTDHTAVRPHHIGTYDAVSLDRKTPTRSRSQIVHQTPEPSEKSCSHLEESSLADPLECGICLDNKACVMVEGCGHFLCCSCAAQLCENVRASNDPHQAPICPFCRCIMGKFVQRIIVNVPMPPVTLVA